MGILVTIIISLRIADMSRKSTLSIKKTKVELEYLKISYVT
jgi:hypothetical protein